MTGDIPGAPESDGPHLTRSAVSGNDQAGDAGVPDDREIRARLDEVIDPCSAARGTALGLVEMGLVRTIDVDDGEVRVGLRLTGPGCMQVPYFVEQVTKRVGSLPGVETVTVSTDAGLEWTPEMMDESARRRRRNRRRQLERRYEELETEAKASDESAD